MAEFHKSLKKTRFAGMDIADQIPSPYAFAPWLGHNSGLFLDKVPSFFYNDSPHSSFVFHN